MREKGTWAILGLVALVVLGGVLLTGVARAQSGAPAQADYDLSWWTVDGGGGAASSGGTYALGGTIGQPDAGLLSEGGYQLCGGYWCGPSGYYIYLPLVPRGYSP